VRRGEAEELRLKRSEGHGVHIVDRAELCAPVRSVAAERPQRRELYRSLYRVDN
jgi:hypothetical protein